MTVLDEILDASTDSSIPVPDLLRKVQIAATRLGAVTIVEWARQELGGYADDATLPAYRVLTTNVMGLFSGPMRSQVHHQLSSKPNGMEHLWEVPLRQPLAEIQAFSIGEGDTDPRRPWTTFDVQRYQKSGVFGIQYHDLFSAWNVISTQSLLGITDTIRTRAMEFALDLQQSFPDAGSLGGPTVTSTPELAQTVYNITNNITGDGTNVATGTSITQTSTVNRGDEKALLARLADLGMDEADSREFLEVLKEEGDVQGPRASKFLRRLKRGALQLSSGLTADVAAEILVTLGKGFLGMPI